MEVIDELKKQLLEIAERCWDEGQYHDQVREEFGDDYIEDYVLRGYVDDAWERSQVEEISDDLMDNLIGVYQQMWFHQYEPHVQELGDIERKRVCKQCGKIFEPHSYAPGIFCSYSCRSIWIMKNMNQEGTKIENLLEEWLIENNVKYEKQYPISFENWGTIVDFYLTEYKICLYADGDYWHTLPGRPRRDREQTYALIKAGYGVIRLWGSDIRAGYRPILKDLEKYSRKP